ncbi:hypothetical protein C0T31_05555, partial [Dysgonamonadaceae bacterium]
RDRFIQSHIKLREVKQLKETAVCESMHGGVRGRGSNPPTYSIVTGLSDARNDANRKLSTDNV